MVSLQGAFSFYNKVQKATLVSLLAIILVAVPAMPGMELLLSGTSAAAGSTVLLSESFESATEFQNWDTSGGTDWDVIAANGYESTKRAESGVGTIFRTIDTTGYEDIHVSFAYKRIGLEAADYGYFSYSSDGGASTLNGGPFPGTGLTNAEGVTDTDWLINGSDLPASLDNNPNFRLGFGVLTSAPSTEKFQVDAIVVTGNPIVAPAIAPAVAFYGQPGTVFSSPLPPADGSIIQEASTYDFFIDTADADSPVAGRRIDFNFVPTSIASGQAPHTVSTTFGAGVLSGNAGIDRTGALLATSMNLNDGDQFTLVVNATDQGGLVGSTETRTYTYQATPIVLSAVTNTTTGENFASLQEANDDSDTLNGHTITINQNLTTVSQVTITKSITINGDGFTVSPVFAKPCPTCNDNNSAIGIINADNVTINNLTIDGTSGTQLHGVNVYESDAALLNGLTINNMNRSAVVVNRSGVTITGITTSGNGTDSLNWAVIDVSSNQVSSPSALTVNGTSVHAEPVPRAHILRIEGAPASIVDSDSQYLIESFPIAGTTYQVYRLGVAIPYTPTAPPTIPTQNGTVIYETMPSVLPSSSASYGYQATQTAEFGDKITFASTERQLVSAAVTLTSWACENGAWNTSCLTTAGTTFTHPVTLTLYSVNGDGSAGSQVGSVTQSFEIPFRPSSDPSCPTPTTWRDTNGNCFNGYNNVVVFNLDGITVPDSVVYGISYNTMTYGSLPLGVTGPYDSLNVALTASAPTVGIDTISGSNFRNRTSAGFVEGVDANGSGIVRFTAKTNTPPVVSFETLTPIADSYVNGMMTPRVVATDDTGMGSYYIRLWKGAFESGITNLVSNNCFSAPGAYLLGTSQDVTCPAIDTTTLDDGVYVLSAQFLDGNGAWGQALRTITVDNTAPEQPVHEYPVNNAYINFNDFYFNWTDAIGADRYETQYSLNSAVDATGAFQTVNWTGDYQSNQPTNSEARSVGANGAWYWQVRSVDAAGNKSSWTAPWKVTIDLVAPNSSISAPTAAQVLAGTTLNVSGIVSDENIRYYYCYLVTNQTITFNGSTYTAGQEVGVRDAACTTTFTSVSVSGQLGGINLTGLPDGSYTVNLVAYDTAGNNNASSPSSVSFLLDNTAPTTAFTNVSTTDTTPPLAGSVDDSNASVEVTVNGQTYPAAVSGATWTIADNTISALGAGVSYDIIVTATDSVGNASTQTFANGLTITAPTPASTPTGNTAVLGALTTSQQVGTPVAVTNNGTGGQPFLVQANGRSLNDSQEEDNVGTESDIPQVLQSSTEDDSSDEQKTDNDTVDDSCFDVFGICWYWYAIPVALVIGYLYYRSRQNENK